MLVTQRAPLLGRVRQARRRVGLHRLPPGGLRWLACFGAIGTALVVRNAYLFTTRIYEDSDFAANTIAVLQAKHFDLLTGNYSRLGFYHPGPAFLYVMAWGEWLFHDVTHILPTPWNGQLLAILLLNAALLSTAICVFARDGGTYVAMACVGTVLAFTVLHPLTVNSNWMPYVYFAPTVLLLVSAAAVAAGRIASLPLLCFAAGLCINGHAEFLFFAPILVLIALVGLFASHWSCSARAAGTGLAAWRSPSYWRCPSWSTRSSTGPASCPSTLTTGCGPARTCITRRASRSATRCASGGREGRNGAPTYPKRWSPPSVASSWPCWFSGSS